ncbi:hypothetical protein Q4485_05375 [Granulosicoccaceae sp. 1_MG-2023]|nr:hypothetical protein [Granulosicoccaceae sp. 1_MG-2023]
MGSLSLELDVARKLYERRLRTLKRIRHHVNAMPATAQGRASAKVAMKLAKAELRSAREQLDSVFEKVRRQSQHPVVTPPVLERDLFSEALSRTDPDRRLQLGK